MLACRQKLFTGDVQFPRCGSGGDDDVASFQKVSAYLNCRWSHKAGVIMEGLNARFGVVCLTILWYRISERSLEADEFRPINPSLIAADPFSLHTLDPIHHFSGANQHFLRVATAKSAGTSKGPRISDCYFPTCRGALRRDRRGSRSGTDDDEVELRANQLCHSPSLK